MKYETKTRILVLETIKKIGKDFKASDILKKLDKKVGRATIYRTLDYFLKENLIIKTDLSTYSYNETCLNDNHFYLKCSKCHKLQHVDCNCILEFDKHVQNKHHFNIDERNLIINGLCKDCLRKEEK